MIILNPLEPWPGNMALPAAVKNDISLITRVVDYGGLFHDDVRPGHTFGPRDHRTFRPAGWVDAARQRSMPCAPSPKSTPSRCSSSRARGTLAGPREERHPHAMQEVAQVNGVTPKTIEEKN